MAITTPALGAGTVLKLGDNASPIVYTTVAYVIDLSGPTEQADDVEVTHLGSSAKEYIAALRDSGEVSMNIHYTEHATLGATSGLYYVFINRLTRSFEIIPSGGAKKFRFSASVTSFERSFNPGESMKVAVTLKVSGAVTEVNVA
jgi:hypothetical protein